MNPGILTPPTQYATMPRGLLGRPTPVPVIDYRTPLDPRTIPGLAVWLDAADRESVTLNGQNVAEWRDKSGNTRHFAQSTAANQPTLAPGVRNGLSAIRSAGGTVHLRRENSGAVVGEQMDYLGPTAHTFFAAVRATPFVGQYLFWAHNPNATNTNRFIVAGPWSANPYYIIDSGNVANGRLQTTVNRSSSAHVIAFRRDGAVFDSWTDSTSSGSATRASAPSVVFVGTLSLFADINFNGSVNAGSFNGDLYEVLHYNRALSADERVAVTRYLGAKWGITV